MLRLQWVSKIPNEDVRTGDKWTIWNTVERRGLDRGYSETQLVDEECNKSRSTGGIHRGRSRDEYADQIEGHVRRKNY
jgi:hypothetical protein